MKTIALESLPFNSLSMTAVNWSAYEMLLAAV